MHPEYLSTDHNIAVLAVKFRFMKLYTSALDSFRDKIEAYTMDAVPSPAHPED